MINFDWMTDHEAFWLWVIEQHREVTSITNIKQLLLPYLEAGLFNALTARKILFYYQGKFAAKEERYETNFEDSIFRQQER